MKIANGYSVIWNRFPAKCKCCGTLVPAKEGIAWSESYGSGWQIAHVECRPDLSDELVADQVERDCREAAKETAKANYLAHLKARLAELESKCGIDWGKGKTVSSGQYAYSDVDLVEFEVVTPLTVKEYDEMVRLKYPVQSSSGALRWLSGVRVAATLLNRFTVQFTTSIAD